MAKKTNVSPETAPSRAKAPASSKTEAPAPKHRRTKAKVTSHHPEVTELQETPKFTITSDDIATLAFSYWERRGHQGGSPEEDWRRAEEELQSLLR